MKIQENTSILIVDDSNENLKLLGNSLKKAGYTVLTALSGKQAIALAKSKLPDLILMDVMMPEMNGFTACEELKKNNSTQSIPVVFLTASDEPESIKNGFDVGGVDYITKPFNPTELLIRIESHIKQHKEKTKREKEIHELLAILKNLSSGITNPVFKLLRNTDLLTQHSYPEPFQTRVNNILISGKEIMRYASGISNLSNLQGSSAVITESKFDLAELFQDLISSIDLAKNNLAEKPKIILKDEIIGHYTADVQKLRSLLLHLIQAVSQSHRSEVSLTLTVKERGEGVEKICLEVLGQNINPENGVLTQSNLSETEIQLLMAGELLRLLSGEISATSFSEKKSFIRIELPLRFEKKKAHTNTVSTDQDSSDQFLSGIKILIVEDNDLNQYFLENVLQRHGAQTSLAKTGAEALQKVSEVDYHIILMDVNIPEISGIAVTRILRDEQNAQTPIIGISGHNDQDIIDQCMKAGMSGFLLKPFTVEHLYNMILEELAKVKIRQLASKTESKADEDGDLNKYSLEKLIELSNGDKSLTESWINNFKALVTRSRIEIREMIENRAYKTGTKIFHDLNNYSTYFGVDLLREYLKDIPHIQKSLPLEDLIEHLILIEAELAGIEEYFNNPETAPKF